MVEPNVEELFRIWQTDDPRRLIGRGHPVGDFLDAPEWEVLARGDGSLRLRSPKCRRGNGHFAHTVSLAACFLGHDDAPWQVVAPGTEPGTRGIRF